MTTGAEYLKQVENGKEIFQKIRQIQREKTLSGTMPSHVILTKEQGQDLSDYFLYEKLISVFEGDRMTVLGMEIIVDENEIIRIT